MLFLSNDDPKSDIQLYINSPGGSVSAGMGIIDTMRYLRSPRTDFGKGVAYAEVDGRGVGLDHPLNRETGDGRGAGSASGRGTTTWGRRTIRSAEK
jgi:hypothetical protein